MEKEVHKTIVNHVTNYPGLLNPNQWAYRKNSSTQLLLLHMQDGDMEKSCVYRKRVVGVVFIDFRKVFDVIPHQQLILKLQLTL